MKKNKRGGGGGDVKEGRIMSTPRREPKAKKTKKLTRKNGRINRDSRLATNNRSGLPFRLILLLYDYYRDNILCSYTYDYALDITKQKFRQKTRCCTGCHDTK